MTEQAQKKISKEAARKIFEAVLTQQYFRLEGPLTMTEFALSVLRDLDELVEGGGGDTLGLFLRQTASKGLVDGEDVERVQSRKPSDFAGDFFGCDALKEGAPRSSRGIPVDPIADFLKDAFLAQLARERETNRSGLNGRKDDLQRWVFVQGDAYFF